MAVRRIHLDTSFLIRALVAGSEPDLTLRRWIREGRHVAMTTVAWAEFACGPLDADSRALASRVVTERIAFDEGDAERAAALFNETGRRRGSLLDCMIAAAASRRGASLATLNRGDFALYEPHDLQIVG